jgi:tetratricopeptide (TPR) repeat protein
MKSALSKEQWARIILKRAKEDLLRNELRRAKDRLSTILKELPDFQPALELMGYAYYQNGDYRNAVVYWGRADYWDKPMFQACEQILKLLERALNKENLHLAKHYLYALAGVHLPSPLAKRLDLLRTAYYKLGLKKLRRTSLAYAPIAGGFLLFIILATYTLFSGKWNSLSCVAPVALATIISVTLINFSTYLWATISFRKTLSAIRQSKSSN